MRDYRVTTMVAADLAAVAEVDFAAFDIAAARAGNAPYGLRRHRLGMEYFRQTAPDLCLVARAGKEVLGYLFGHRWGSTTWTGPIGVAAEYMNHGVGSKLLAEFVQRASTNDAGVIGLETSIGHNIRLYERRGFMSHGLRLLAVKNFSPQAPVVKLDDNGIGQVGEYRLVPWTSLPSSEQTVRASEARRMAGLVSRGLDHSSELSAVPAHGMGETYIALNSQGQLSGYAALHLRNYRSQDFDDKAPPLEPLVWVMVGWPVATQALLLGCEAIAVAAGGSRLRLPIYSANPHSWVVAKEAGYRIETAFLRLIYRGDYPGTAAQPWGSIPLDFSSWLG